MKKVLSFVIILAFVLAVFTGCSGNNNQDDNKKPSNLQKQTPVYQGMSISSVNTGVADSSATIPNVLAGTNNGNGNNGDNGNHYGQYKGDHNNKNEEIDSENPYPNNSENENIENEIESSLKVDGAVHDIYYSAPNEDIYIYIHINNPDSFEIISFTLNGKKYSSYMFEDGSDMETIILRYNAGSLSGIVEYTIDAIKYIDGTEIKDVIIDGDKTVRVGIKKEDQVTANVSNIDINTNSVSFNVNVVDSNGVVAYSDGSLLAVVYDGVNIVAEKDISLGENNIIFDGLKTNTLYQYAIIGYYDDLSGEGFGMNVLYKDIFYTEAVVLFDNITVWQDAIDYTFLWHEDHQNKNIKSLKLYKDETLVKEVDTTATSITGLLSSNTYTIIAEYQNGDDIESIYLEFTTFEKGVPGFNFSVNDVTQTSVSFNILEVDSENVGSITKIELIHANGTVVAENLDVREFANLLSNNDYTIKVTYTYDLNDGTGSKDIVKELSFKTQAKTVPEILVNNPTSTQTSVGFDIVEVDPDNVGTIDKIELVHANGTTVADSADQRVFENLITNDIYTVRVTYIYDLNDGEGNQSIIAELNIKTVAKSSPVVTITNTNSDGNSVLFDIARNDPDGVITKIVASINLGDTKISENECENSCYFGELLYSTTYTVRLTIFYDLLDGVGTRTVEVLDTVTTANYTDSQGFTYVLNLDNTAYVKSYVGSATELEVPSTVLGYTVTGICENAFANAEITSIVIPSTVNSIGSAAFSGCNKLESITIPFVGGAKDATSLSASTLFGFIFGTSSYDGGIATNQYCAYSGSGYGISFYSPITYYIPETLKSVTVVGDSILSCAFIMCSNITEVYIGDGVSKIGDAAFYGCKNLQKVDLSNSINTFGVYTFLGCRSLTELVLPSNLEAIPGGCFSGCNNLSRIYIPEGVSYIGDNSFYDCYALKSIVVPKSVNSIGFSAFQGCYNLERITLPFVGESIYNINENTHFGYIFGAYTYKEHNNLYGTNTIPYSLKEVIVTGAMTEDYLNFGWGIDEYAFYSCLYIERIVIGDGFITIGDCAFQNCESLKSIAFGEHLNFIGDEAFEGCWWLTNVYHRMSKNMSVNIGTENERLTEANTFYYMESNPALECLEGKYWRYVDGIETPWEEYVAPVSEGLKYQYTYSPHYYNIIAGIGTCKDSVIYIPTIAPNRWGLYYDVIGEKAFEGCSQITEVVIPKNIKEIRDYAFSDCTNLTTIKYRGTEEEWNAITKGEGWNANTNLTIIFNYKGD